MAFVYIVKKTFCATFTCHDLDRWNKMNHLCQLINHHKNGVVGLGTWDISDEFHRNRLPWIF